MARDHRECLKQSFENVEFMCATTDIWTRSNRSFIAVSVHYFEELTLKSKFIACDFFPGRHTHDRVANKLNEIFGRYDICDKVFFVTTDGAGEYTAAFKYFGDNYTSFRFQENLDWLDGDGGSGGGVDDDVAAENAGVSASSSKSNANEQNVNKNKSDTSAPDSDSDDEMGDDQFINLDENERNFTANSSAAIDASDCFRIEELPTSLGKMNRIDCAAHMMDKLGKKDALNASNDACYSDLYDRTFGKLESIWNVKESRLNAEIFTRKTGRKMIRPHRIRWLKTWEAVSKYLF